MEQSNKNVITYEKVKNELKNVNLADMTKQQVFDRFIAYGNSEELNNPEIQKVLIQNGYANELMDMVTIITDEEVVKLLYQSKAFENYAQSGIRLYHGKLLEIKTEKNNDIFNINYEFLEFERMGRNFIGDIAFLEDEINQIKSEIEPYKDKLIAVCDFNSQRKSSEKYHLKCFLKEIINIEEYITKCQFKLENAKNVMERICNSRLEEIYGQEIPKQIQTRYENELNLIFKNNYESLFVLNCLIAKKAKKDNEYYVLRGLGSNSYIAYLLGISELNPLVYELEYEMTYGIDGEKAPQFYYYFSDTYYPNIMKYVKETVTKNISYDTTYIDNNLIKHVVHIYIFRDRGIDALYELKKITGMDYNCINFNDKKIWDTFRDYNKLFCYMPSYFNKSLFQQIQPKSLEELCAIYGLTKSTFDFEEGKDLVEQIIKMKEYSTRDDIYSFLLSKNIEKELAFEITEFIRKGKAYNIKYSEQWDEYQKIMKKHNIDSTYIEKCKKIKYLFPKSNILNSVVYLIKHIAYMAYYPEIAEKVISKAPRLF